jgi:iron complex transport system substrate-binding protein
MLWAPFVIGSCQWSKLSNQYATQFSILQHGDNFKLLVRGQAPIYLYRSKKIECGEGIYIKYPVTNIATFSTTYLGFLKRLQELDRVKFLSSIKYVSSPTIKKRYRSDDIKTVGYPPRAELLLKYRPQLVLDFPPVGVPSSYLNLIKGQIPVLFMQEHLESTPLARAEWIKVFGLLTGKFKLANKIFLEIRKQYRKIQSRIKYPYRGAVLVGKLYNGIWNAPGARSYLVRFLTDLQVPYLFAQEQGERLLLPWEKVIVLSKKATVWLPEYGWTKREEIFRENSQYKMLPKRVLDHIYTNSRRVTGSANDYWESGAAFPEVILQDLATIFYPTLFTSNPLYFYIRL